MDDVLFAIIEDEECPACGSLNTAWVGDECVDGEVTDFYWCEDCDCEWGVED